MGSNGSAFLQAIHNLAPHTAHLHVADAKGDNGEGLQIGHGDIDFSTIWPLIENSFANVSFVPEVWQGHKNSGAGFWNALDKLESYR